MDKRREKYTHQGLEETPKVKKQIQSLILKDNIFLNQMLFTKEGIE